MLPRSLKKRRFSPRRCSGKAEFGYEGEIKALTGDPWYYRNRIQLHFDGRTVGYRRAASHEVYPVAHCEISSPVLNEVIRKLQDAVKTE